MSPLRACWSPAAPHLRAARFGRAQRGEEKEPGPAPPLGEPRGAAAPLSRAGAPLVRASEGTEPLPYTRTGSGGGLRRGGGARASRRLVAASAPAPGRRAAPGKLLVGARAAGPRLQDPQRGSRGRSGRQRPPGALGCPRLPTPALLAAPARSSLLPVSLPPAASTQRAATSASRAGRPSRLPAGPPASLPRPPSFVVR